MFSDKKAVEDKEIKKAKKFIKKELAKNKKAPVQKKLSGILLYNENHYVKLEAARMIDDKAVLRDLIIDLRITGEVRDIIKEKFDDDVKYYVLIFLKLGGGFIFGEYKLKLFKEIKDENLLMEIIKNGPDSIKLYLKNTNVLPKEVIDSIENDGKLYCEKCEKRVTVHFAKDAGIDIYGNGYDAWLCDICGSECGLIR